LCVQDAKIFFVMLNARRQLLQDHLIMEYSGFVLPVELSIGPIEDKEYRG
jgi:hypothetical protein